MNCETSHNHVIKLHYLELLKCFEIFISNPLLRMIFMCPLSLLLKIFWRFQNSSMSSFFKFTLTYPQAEWNIFPIVLHKYLVHIYFYYITNQILVSLQLDLNPTEDKALFLPFILDPHLLPDFTPPPKPYCCFYIGIVFSISSLWRI